MGFKSNARKRREQSTGSEDKKKSEEEFVGQVKCDVSGCGNWADKKVGGRKLAFDRVMGCMGRVRVE